MTALLLRGTKDAFFSFLTIITLYSIITSSIATRDTQSASVFAFHLSASLGVRFFVDQCSELVFSKDTPGSDSSLGLGLGESRSSPEPSPTPRSKESLESLESARLLRQVSRLGNGGGDPKPPRAG